MVHSGVGNLQTSLDVTPEFPGTLLSSASQWAVAPRATQVVLLHAYYCFTAHSRLTGCTKTLSGVWRPSVARASWQADTGDECYFSLLRRLLVGVSFRMYAPELYERV
jgi:hypothetical protein